MSIEACINIESDFWAKLEELRTVLDNFSNEEIEMLKLAINLLDKGRENFMRKSELDKALLKVLDATDEKKWLLQVFRARSDPSAQKVIRILEELKIMVLNPTEKYYQFEYIEGPEFIRRRDMHFLLSQLRDHCDSQ